jgi:hypothetical protein
MTKLCTDPMERIIEAALIDAGIAYESDFGGGTSHHLDFHLTDYGIAIEVKRLHSARISDQMARADNVIVAQGKEAVEFLANAIRALPSALEGMA